MGQLSTEEVQRELSEEYIVSLLSRQARIDKLSSPSIGFEDREFRWYILGILRVPEIYLSEFQYLLKRYFGPPIKGFGEYVRVQQTVPEFYVEFLNRMNGFLHWGVDVTNDLLTLDELARRGNLQYGASVLPPINLFNNQAFYGKSSEDGTRIELARICPYAKRGLFRTRIYATIEYMLCSRKE